MRTLPPSPSPPQARTPSCWSQANSWHPCAITNCNKQSWLCQDMMCPLYEGPLHHSNWRPTDRRTSMLCSFNGPEFSSMDAARSANGEVFDHSQIVVLLWDTLETLAGTASGATTVLAVSYDTYP